MLDITQYSGPGRVGCSRPLTANETQAWVDATSTWHDAPPWTEEALADNEVVRSLLISLYEDGVSLPALAAAAGWKHARVAGMIHRLRLANRLSGKRRYIAPAVKAEKNPFRRDLTVAERRNLRTLYSRLPLHASGVRGWKSAQAEVLLARLDALANDRVAMDTLGNAIGASRQAIHQHLTRYRARQANDVTSREAVAV
jgi:hypothetical protein